LLIVCFSNAEQFNIHVSKIQRLGLLRPFYWLFLFLHK